MCSPLAGQALLAQRASSSFPFQQALCSRAEPLRNGVHEHGRARGFLRASFGTPQTGRPGNRPHDRARIPVCVWLWSGQVLTRDDETQDHLPLRIISIETGQVLREFNQLMRKGKKIDVIEQFNQKLLLKQACSCFNRTHARSWKRRVH
eukprot:6211295-Pleurochrysis_carterae.AAC.2